MTGAKSLPLAGVRVLEVATVIMGPYAGKGLVDLGAEVIKAEQPGGDIGRHIGYAAQPGMSALAIALNSGKRSIALDLHTEGDRGILRDLIGWADVVLTNHPPARRRQFGLDYESVREANPRAILCTGQGFASQSPRADEPAYDDLAQAASGICDLYRRLDGHARYSPYVVADKVCGLMMVQAVLAALLQRGPDGEGTWVDVPMVDTMAAFTLTEHLGGRTYEPASAPTGWTRVLSADHTPLPALDGDVCVMPYTDRNWRDFVALVGRPELLDDPNLATNSARNTHPEDYARVLSDYTRTRSVARIEQECRERGIPVQRVVGIDELMDDPYFSTRPLVEHRDDPVVGPHVRLGTPIAFAGTPAARVRGLATLDADREEILTEIGRPRGRGAYTR